MLIVHFIIQSHILWQDNGTPVITVSILCQYWYDFGLSAVKLIYFKQFIIMLKIRLY